MNNTGRSELKRTDSSALINALGYLNSTSSLSNPVTGLNTSRDPNSYTRVNLDQRILTFEELTSLYTNTKIQRIVNTYPLEASWFNLSFHDSRYSNTETIAQVETDLNNLASGSLHSKFIDASIEARLHGLSYLLIKVDDGKDWSEPINWDKINNLVWLEVRCIDQVKQLDSDTFEVILTNENPKRYWLRENNLEKIKVHRDRLLEFTGIKTPSTVRRLANRSLSSVQGVYDAFVRLDNSMAVITAMLNDYNIFIYKLKGLSKLVQSGDMDALVSRFKSIQMSKSVLQGLALDAMTEEAEFISRSFANLDKVVEAFEQDFVSSSGLVRYKLLGSPNKSGLGAESRGLQDRLEHSARIKAFQQSHWLENIRYVIKIYLLSKSSATKGKLPASVKISFPSVLELNPMEIAELKMKNANYLQSLQVSQILDPYESRLALANHEISPDLIFDNRYTALLDATLDESTNVFSDDSEVNDVDTKDLEIINEDNELNTIVSENIKPDTDQSAVYNSTEIYANDSAEIRTDSLWGIWFKGRNTPAVVEASSRNEAINKAKNKKVAGYKEPVISARLLKGKSLSEARQGKWVRERSSGTLVKGKASDLPASESPSKFRPHAYKATHKKSDSAIPNENVFTGNGKKQHNPGMAKYDDAETLDLSAIDTDKLERKLKVKSRVSTKDVDKVLGLLPETGKQEALEEILEQDEKTIERLTTRLASGSLDLEEYTVKVADIIKRDHILATASAKDFEPLTNQDRTKVSFNLKEQYYAGYDSGTDENFGLTYLAQDAVEGLSEDMLANRAKLYARSYKVSENQIEIKEAKTDYTEARRILYPGENCPECIEYASYGWVGIDNLIPPATNCSCRNNCKCTVEYR